MNIKPIKTETDYTEALQAVENLMDAKIDTPEGHSLDVLVTLIEAYEENPSANNYIHTERLTLPIFGGNSKLLTTSKSFLGWLATGDVWRRAVVITFDVIHVMRYYLAHDQIIQMQIY